jgi:NRPS condensation-like uncharacterized protein
VHFEVRVAGRLDVERLAAALQLAVERHPIARARLGTWHYADRGYRWDVVDKLSGVPLQIVDCRDEAALADARERHFAYSPALDVPPPFVPLLAHAPDGDALVLNISHAAMDGVGAARLMLSILRAYAQVNDPVPSFDPLAARDVRVLAGAQSARDRCRRAGALARDAARRAMPATRVARDGDTDGPAYGFEFICLSADESETVRQRRTPTTTVNDVLLGALAVTIARWNRRHGRAAGRIDITMPVNLRPEMWRNEVVANFASFATVSIGAHEHGDLVEAITVAGRRTGEIKREELVGIVVDVLDRLAMLPVGVKRLLPDLIPLSGNMVVDTASLSNLGILDELPLLGDDAGPVRSVWFSQPGRMPLGTCIGVLTVEGRLHLTLRYRHAQFNSAAARAFIAMYRDLLLA